MKYRYLRIAFSVTCGIACVLLVVLWVRSYWSVDMEETHAFTRFKKIESIEIRWNLPNELTDCDVPESKWSEFASIFQYGIRDPNEIKFGACR